MVDVESSFETALYTHIEVGEGGFATGPVRALLSALLFDGIQAYINYLQAKTPEEHSRFREAVSWVHGKDAEYIFCFDNVCSGLGIDPDYLRLGLVNAAGVNAIRRKSPR